MDSLAASSMYADSLFAPVGANQQVQRIAGGNETEVYCTDNGKYVMKVKSEGGGSIQEAMAEARTLRDAARAFSEVLGPDHAIPNLFFIARNNEGQIQPVVVQPYVQRAQPLFDFDYETLSDEERQALVRQLRRIIRRSVAFFWKTGCMPDLYGRMSHSKTERKRLNAPHMLPYRLWSFLIKRNLLRSHNLVLTQEEGDKHLVLVDYDPVKKSPLYRFIYYHVRLVLFLRDLALIWWLEKTGHVFRLLGPRP